MSGNKHKADKKNDKNWPDKISIISFIVSIASASIAAASLYVTHHNDRLGNATEQPYVVPAYPVSVGYSGIKYTLEHGLSFKNLGKTPALNARYKVAVKSFGQKDGGSCSHFFKTSSYRGVPYHAKGFSMQNLGPGDTFYTRGLFQNGVGNLITNKKFLMPKSGGNKFWPVHICIVVFYKTIFGSQIRGDFSFQTPIISKETKILFPAFLNKYDGGCVVFRYPNIFVPIYMDYSRIYPFD